MPSQHTSLSSHVLLCEPLIQDAAGSQDPSLIMLFGWVDARVNHLLKYVEALQINFPASVVVVIKATKSFYFSTQRSLEPIFQPALHVLQREMSKPARFRGVLLHVLSNGGGFHLVLLRKMLAKVPIPSESLSANSMENAPTALVLDSVPGDRGLQSAIRSLAPRHPVLHALAVPPVAAIYGLFILANDVVGNARIFPELRATLLEQDVLPPITAKITPRLYVYSRADTMVDAHHISAHVEEARRRVDDVDELVFADSPHVAHLRTDPDRYWAAVTGLWKRAVRKFSVSKSSL